VLKQLKLPQQYINAYHQDTTLLFQFILSETLLALSEAKILGRLTSASKTGEFNNAVAALRRLVGAAHDPFRLFSWNPDEGILPKLKSYCGYFVQNISQDDKIHQPLYRAAEQAWLLSLVCVDDLRNLENPEAGRTQANAIIKSSKKLFVALQKLGKYVSKAIEQYWDDENVVFFVLRNKEQFDEIFGNRFVKQLLRRMYPGGIEGARRFLSQQFIQRGFHHLVPIIQARITEVETSVA